MSCDNLIVVTYLYINDKFRMLQNFSVEGSQWIEFNAFLSLPRRVQKRVCMMKRTKEESEQREQSISNWVNIV